MSMRNSISMSMRTFRQKSLQARLLGTALLVVCVVWIVAMAFTLNDARHELDEVLDDNLVQVANLLISQPERPGEKNTFLATPSEREYAPQIRFQIFRQSSLLSISETAEVKPMSRIVNGFDNVTLENGEAWRVFAINDATKGIQVYVAEQMQSRIYVLKAVLRGMLLPFLIGLPLLILFLWWVVRRGLSPLRALSQGLYARQPQSLHAIQFSETMPSEIKPIVHALNGLFERIEGMLLAERRFTADAAHELRTPIAAIRAQAQVALGAGAHAAQRDHALQATLAGCDRATRLVEQLLMLARLEAVSENVPENVSKDAVKVADKATASVDLRAVCRRVLSELAPLSLARRQTLELAAPNTCFIVGDDLLVGVLVRNLVDNAIRYSQDGSRIFVYAGSEAASLILRIEDSGQGMTESEMARLGERFFRVLGHEQPGSGLGWSIVTRISKVFGATLTLNRSSTLGGLSVTVRWQVG
jgi:two-component system, OmpR family, sensor histidine kinase QseC